MSDSLHVEVAGRASVTGPSWLLLHGWGLNLRVFDALTESLATFGHVVRVDLPGHGRSPIGDAVTFDAQAHALLAALPAAAVIVGWSLGGQFALRLATLAPSQVHGLALIASTPRFVAAPDWPAGMRPQFVEAFAARLQTDWRGVLAEFLELQVRGSREAAAVLTTLQQALADHGAPDPRALATGLRFLRDNDLRELARRTACPALLVSGQHDRVTPPAASAWLAATLPHARHVDVPRAGHAPFLSHPDETLAQLRTFASELAA